MVSLRVTRCPTGLAHERLVLGNLALTELGEVDQRTEAEESALGLWNY